MDMTSQIGSSSVRRRSAYPFPVLKPTEIIQCLAELGCEITKEDLEEPQHSKEKIRQVFMTMLETCTGKGEEDLKPTQGRLDEIARRDFPEMYSPENTKEMKFFAALRDLMTSCLYSEFQLRDLHVPVPKRLRVQLSAVINLVKYLEGEQMKIFSELNEPRNEFIEALQGAQEEHEELSVHLVAVEEEAARRHAEMEEIIRECEELEIEIARNNRRQTAARQEADALKKKANDLNDEVQTTEWALEEVEAEEEKLRAQVVSSPERHKAELNELKTELEYEKEECTRLEVAVQECKTKYRNGLKIYEDLKSSINYMEEVQEAANVYSENVEKLREIGERIESTDKKASDVDSQIVESERELNRIEDKIVHQRKQHQLQLDALQDALNTAKDQLLRVEKDRRDAMARVEAGENEVRALEICIENEKAKTEQEIKEMITEYEKVQHHYLASVNRRMTALEC